MPDSNYYKPGGFYCDVCNKHFCRMDHLIAHNKTESHCRYLANKFEVVKFEPKAITAPDINVNDKRLSNYYFFIY